MRFYALALGIPEQDGGMSVANHGHSDPSPAAAWQAERGERPAAAKVLQSNFGVFINVVILSPRKQDIQLRQKCRFCPTDCSSLCMLKCQCGLKVQGSGFAVSGQRN